MSIAERLTAVRDRLAAAARAAGREPSSVRLLAVSKTKSEAEIREAYAAGQRAFGESYAQDLAVKASALADLADLEWHFIGHLQTNKAKIVAQHAHVVHTVDSVVLARELGKRLERAGRGPIDAFVEVNVAQEPQKHGAPPQDVDEVLSAVRGEPRLRAIGLMTIPPAGDLAQARGVFDTLVSLRNLHGGAAALPELSMGMSEDLEVAVAAGATWVRVGTAIFGER